MNVPIIPYTESLLRPKEILTLIVIQIIKVLFVWKRNHMICSVAASTTSSSSSSSCYGTKFINSTTRPLIRPTTFDSICQQQVVQSVTTKIKRKCLLLLLFNEYAMRLDKRPFALCLSFFIPSPLHFYSVSRNITHSTPRRKGFRAAGLLNVC